ncbi:DUF3578 domain-containing protein [Janthinobacterium lividum]|nr:DUF3578 domain-containing protein [Janthinobacterium lividum]
MSNVFSELIKRIAAEFPTARTQSLKDHPLAKAIRNDWSSAAHDLALPKYQNRYKFASSPGAGQWNSAPWLAVLHPDVTDSAQAGYYPVYLFEPEFQTVCLVLGQGAQRLEQGVGKPNALIELRKRAERLRNASDAWKHAGFSAGPFQTSRDTAAKRVNKGDSGIDPWAAAVAFGKRYQIAALPAEDVLRADLNKMLAIYNDLVRKNALDDLDLDEIIADMASTGELPPEEEGGIDGAKRVANHKKYEYRHRNKALIKRVKKKLGSTCQACKFRFEVLYGALMADFIEAHHNQPLSELPEKGAILTPTEDHFMVLCSNCHRAIHAAGCPDLVTFKATLIG